MNEFLTGLDVVEYGPFEQEVAAVDPDVGIAKRFDFLHQPAATNRDVMTAHAGPDAQEGGRLLLLFEGLNQVRKMKVRQIVAVVRKEHFVAIQIFLNSLQPLADIRIRARVHERYRPVFDIAVKHFHIPAAVDENEVVGYQLAVIHKIVLDDVRAIAETENEILVAEVRVILHHMPQDGTVTDMHHRLGRTLARLPDAHTESAAEKDYFHACHSLQL